MARTHEWTECLVDWVSGRVNQTRFNNLWLGGGAGPEGGTTYRPIDGQLTQRHVCYDTSEPALPCSPSGFSSLMDNLRRIRYWQEPATWFGVTTTSGLKVTIKPGLWYPSTTEYCSFAGGDSPTFTLPAALDRIDTVYIDASGVLHIKQGTPAVSPTITLPAIASGIPLWAVYLTPTASGIYHTTCSGYYAGQGYIERDLRPFLNLGGGGAAASGIPNATAEGQAIVSDATNEWIADLTPLWKGEHSFEAGIAFVGTTGNNSITIPDTAVNALHILDAITGNEYLRIDTDNKYVLIDPTADGIKVGIGLTTVPHGGVGAAKVAITGIDVSANGPHVQFTTDSDDYPLLQVLANKHDAVAIVFDAYYDYASWKSSDAGSNCLLYKESDDFLIAYDSGVAQGGNITWNTGIIMDLATGDVGIGVSPNQKLTVEGTIDLKEQAAAGADVASYGQIWVKNTTPNELWFTDDAGTDFQLGLAGGGMPGVAAAGYALISTGVNTWAADDTPAWLGRHSFAAGITFNGGAGVNSVIIPDALTDAFDITNGVEFLRLDTYNDYFLIDPAGAGIKVGIGITPTQLLHLSSAAPSIYIRNTNYGAVDIVVVELTDAGIYYTGWSQPSYIIRTSSSNSLTIASGSITVHGTNACVFLNENTTIIGRAGGPNYHITGSALGDLCIRSTTGQKLLLGTHTTLGIAIDAGKVGIGTTGPKNSLHLQGTTATNMLNFDVANGSILGNNIYNSAGWKRVTAGYVALCNYNDGGAAGDISFYQATTGIADSAIAFGDPTLYLKNNGKVGIGTTSPDNPLELLSTTTPQFRITHTDATDYATFSVDGDGQLDITTVDGGGAGGHICLMPDGYTGIGRSNPYGPLHGYGSYGGFIFFEATSIGAGEVTIIPDLAGDVVYMLSYNSVLHCIQDQHNTGSLETPGAGNIEATLYTGDGSGNVFKLRLYSSGQVTIYRSAGGALGRVALWLTWL